MDILRAYCLQFTGLPYRWGGDDPMKGFDCSGFVQEALASVGLDLPGDQTAQALYDHFAKDGTWGVYGCGSLAFYGAAANKITHVAIMIDTYRIFEFGGGGSKTNTLEDASNQNAYGRIRLLKNRKDLVAVIKPKYTTIGQL